MSMWEYVSCVQVPAEARKGHWISESWSYIGGYELPSMDAGN